MISCQLQQTPHKVNMERAVQRIAKWLSITTKLGEQTRVKTRELHCISFEITADIGFEVHTCHKAHGQTTMASREVSLTPLQLAW